MKWQPSATSPRSSRTKAAGRKGFFGAFNPRLSKILTVLVALAAVKLGVLLFLSLDILAPDVPNAPAASGTIATGNVPGNVFVASVMGPDKAMAQTAAPQAAPQASPQASTDKLPSLTDIQELNQRKEELDRKEQALKRMEEDLNKRLADLNQIESQLKEAIKGAQEAKDKQLKHLIDVYTNMKAKQAAAVLETLDEDIAVKILAGMKGRQAGEILTSVSAKKAAALSEKLTQLQMPKGDLPAMP